MSDSKIAPIRPSIAKFLKRQIGGFVREYDREVTRSEEATQKPEPQKNEEPPAQPATPGHPE